MKKVIYIITAVILVISSVCINVSATQKVTITDSHLVFDVWQGEGESSVMIEENCFSVFNVKTSDFEMLIIDEDKVNENNFYVSDCEGATVITLKENYLSTLEDGCYYLTAEFKTAIIPINLYIVRKVFKVSDLCYNFTPWLGADTATATINPNYSPVPIWPDLFESLSFADKEVDKENYSLSVFTDILNITLSEEYLKTFSPGEYYFFADFTNLKEVMIKIRIYGDNVPGDVDCDRKITAKDARITLRASVNLENLSTEQYIAADIDGDSRITASDARTLLRISVGLEEFEQIINKSIR